MKLIETDGNENHPINRMVSENNQWEIGIRPVLFGFRVSASRVGSLCYSLDYCAADDSGFLLQLYAVCIRLLELLPEDTSGEELRRMLPGYERRPINLDPCWDNLLELVSTLEGASKDLAAHG